VENFDFDMIISGWGQALSPGNEQRNYWGSQTADRKGSRNLVGIKNPAIDKLIGKLIYAKDRSELVAVTRALDRVLLWNHFVVPQWYSKGTRLARWNRFGFPEKTPDYRIGFPDIWWFDEIKAASVKK
jgi:microcin C transport system substrate-binding protein